VVSDNGPARWSQLAAAWADSIAVEPPVADGALLAAVVPPATSPAMAPLPAAAAGQDASPLGSQPQIAGFDPSQVTALPQVAGSDGSLPAVPAPAADSQAVAAGTAGGVLVLVLPFARPRAGGTPFSVEVRGADGQAVPLIGRTAADGTGEPIALPALPAPPQQLTVRVPGFRPQHVVDLYLGGGETRIDLRGSLVPMFAGELTADDTVDARDGLAWLRLAVARSPEADLDGDGGLGVGDLGLLLRVLAPGD
jgi:hypothetical protein